MTLILALKWLTDRFSGVVVASDSRATVGPGIISYEVTKVYPIVLRVGDDVVPLAIVAGAGDAALVKQGYELCGRVLREMAVREWDSSVPSFEQFRGAVESIESSLISRLGELRKHGIDPGLNLILSSVDREGNVSIYKFGDNGLAEPMHDTPGFAAAGKGFITGAALLLNLLGYKPEKSYMMDLGALTAFIIDVVSSIDPTVGPFIGESWFMRAENGKVMLGPLKKEALEEYKRKTEMRKEIIRKLWRLLDIIENGERIISKNLDKLEEEYILKTIKNTDS